MKKRIFIGIIMVALLSCTLFTFAACSSKQVPVYQGMTITDGTTVTAYGKSSRYLQDPHHPEPQPGGGGHDGGYSGDYTGRNDDIDKENPFPDSNQNIEDEVKSSLNVVGATDPIYYAVPNQDIYINIHIDNPDGFEIMSFTLNGKKYTSYMFEDGSDLETIILKYNVGDVSGIMQYTIDAIKYIDGTQIKDVIIDGDKTVLAGIKTQQQLTATVSDIKIDSNQFDCNVTIRDRDNLIDFSDGVLKFALFDGENIVFEHEIIAGENSINAKNLKTNTLYQYAVVGYFDDLSGEGYQMHVLQKDAFYTDSVVLFDNVNVSQTGISFGLAWNESHSDKNLSSLKLYQNEKLIDTLQNDATSAGNLLSNNTYKLVAEYANENATESISLEFTTVAKAVPEVAINSTKVTQTSVEFAIDVVDEDSVGAISEIKLIHGENIITAENADVRKFENLLPTMNTLLKLPTPITLTMDKVNLV